MEELLYVLLKGGGIPPKRASEGSAGFDISVPGRTVVPAHAFGAKIALGLAVTPPVGTYARTVARSSVAMRGVVISADVIDRDYTGEIHVVVANLSDRDVVFQRGDRICQLVLEKYQVAEVRQVETLQPTARGRGGFGSSNK